MIKFENYEVVGWEHAIRGMRNPKNSWAKSDSKMTNAILETTEVVPGVEQTCYIPCECFFNMGPNDHDLAMKLVRGGPVHAKFRRMIVVYVDITAPLYWWKEFDTYKVGTVCNSCSTMHTIHEKEFTLDDFSWDRLLNTGCDLFEVTTRDGLFTTNVQPLGILTHYVIPALNVCREKYNETKLKPMKEESKRKELLDLYFNQMIQLLPSSYNQRRTIKLNYEVLANIFEWRSPHKLAEWRHLCDWIETLPYSEIITGKNKED